MQMMAKIMTSRSDLLNPGTILEQHARPWICPRASLVPKALTVMILPRLTRTRRASMAKLRGPLLAVLKKKWWRRINLPQKMVLMGRRTTVLPPSPTKTSIPVDPPIILRKRKSHTNTGEEDDLLLSLQRRPRRRHHHVLTNE